MEHPPDSTLLTGRQIGDLLERYGINPSRALGQNFVTDPNTVRRIARLAEIGSGDDVVEIGPGLGSLTLALLETGARVTAVELDRHLIPILRGNVEPRGARVIHGDAMAMDWVALLGDRPWTLVANLPYNVATPLVADLLDGVPQIRRMLVMVQREVAERLAAAPGTGAYGAVSVKVAYWASARVVGVVPSTVFVPQPKVESALVRIDRRPVPAVDPSEVEAGRLFGLVRQAFQQRRKMLRRSLSGVAGGEAFLSAGISPEARPESLDVEAWGRLARAVQQAQLGPEAALP